MNFLREANHLEDRKLLENEELKSSSSGSGIFPQPTSMPTQIYVAPSVPVDQYGENILLPDGEGAIPSFHPTSISHHPTIIKYDFNTELKNEQVTVVDTNLGLILGSIAASIVLVLIFLRRFDHFSYS